MRPIKAAVKRAPLRLRPAFDAHNAQRLFPILGRLPAHGVETAPADLAPQILSGLLGADKRCADTQRDRGGRAELGHAPDALSVCCLCLLQCAILEGS